MMCDHLRRELNIAVRERNRLRHSFAKFGLLEVEEEAESEILDTEPYYEYD